MSAFTRRPHDDPHSSTVAPAPEDDTTPRPDGLWWLPGHRVQPADDDHFTPSAFGM